MSQPTVKLIRFSKANTMIVLPDGEYVGTPVACAHQLGRNGSSLTWTFVQIIETPKGAERWMGKELNVRQPDAPSLSPERTVALAVVVAGS